jgi:hypothetical protein
MATAGTEEACFNISVCLFLCCPSWFALQDVLKQWQSYAPELQRELFDAALLVASRGAWSDLQDDLQLVRDLAAG